MCNCACAAKKDDEDTIKYYCAQCNAIKEAKSGEPRPECCGKRMSEVD